MLRINPRLRILVCSETHVAVDNLIEKFYKLNKEEKIRNLNAVRVFSKNQSENEAIKKSNLDTKMNDYLNTLHKSRIGDNIVEDLYHLMNDNIKDINRWLTTAAQDKNIP